MAGDESMAEGTASESPTQGASDPIVYSVRAFFNRRNGSYDGKPFLVFECPKCGDLHLTLDEGRDTTYCGAVSLALAEYENPAEVDVEYAGEITDAELDAWQRRIERRWFWRLSWVIETRKAYLSKHVERVRRITPRLRSKILRRDMFRCRRCGASADHGRELVVDHVIPVALGGADNTANLQVLCGECNAAKGSQIPAPHDLRRRVVDAVEEDRP